MFPSPSFDSVHRLKLHLTPELCYPSQASSRRQCSSKTLSYHQLRPWHLLLFTAPPNRRPEPGRHSPTLSWPWSCGVFAGRHQENLCGISERCESQICMHAPIFKPFFFFAVNNSLSTLGEAFFFFFLCRLTTQLQVYLLWVSSEGIDLEFGGQTYMNGSFSSLLQPRLGLFWSVEENAEASNMTFLEV